MHAIYQTSYKFFFKKLTQKKICLKFCNFWVSGQQKNMLTGQRSIVDWSRDTWKRFNMIKRLNDSNLKRQASTIRFGEHFTML